MAAPLPLSMGFLPFLESRPLAELIFKDVTGFNIPKITFNRTEGERWDRATLEFSNTAITLGASLTLPHLMRYAAAKIAGVNPKDLLLEASTPGLSSKLKLAKTAASFGFLFPFAAAFWGAAFFRNWLTIKRTNNADFDSMIGLKNQGAKKRSVEKEKAHQMKMALGTVGLGFAAGLASLLGFGLAAKRFAGNKLPNLVERLFEGFHLSGKGGYEIKQDKSVFLFWSVPAYLGWLHAARGKNERWEQSLSAANGTFWFFVAPKTIDLWFKKVFDKVPGIQSIPGYVKGKIPDYSQFLQAEGVDPALRETLRKLKNKQFGTRLAFTALMLGTTPQLLNQYFTRKRNEAKLQAAKYIVPSLAMRPQGSLRLRPDSPFLNFQASQALR